MEKASDTIGLLRKIEQTYDKLLESRKIFAFFDPNTLFKKEKEVRD